MTQQSIEFFKNAARLSIADIDHEELIKGSVPRQRESVVVRLRAGAGYFKRIYSQLVRSNGKNTHFDADRETMVTEMNFFRDRNADEQEAAQRLIACDLIVKEDYPLDRLLSAIDESANDKIYNELTNLENIRLSQIATLSLSPGLKFEHQSGSARIALAKFLLIKTRLCYVYKKVKLNIKNYEDHFLDHTDIRLDDIRRRMHQLFNEARAVGEHNPEAFQSFKAAVAALTADTTRPIDLPEKAPELYKERADRKEKPDAFIERVYAPWLGKGLMRPHIKALDEPLYRALYKHGVPDAFETLLPAAQGKSGEHLYRTDAERVAALKATQKRADAKRRKCQLAG